MPMTIAAVPAFVFGLALSLIPCCCCTNPPGAVFGGLAAFVARDRDQTLEPGQGFLVAFLGSGVGSLLAAMVRVLRFGARERAEFEEQFQAGSEEFFRSYREENPDVTEGDLAALQDVLDGMFDFYMSPFSTATEALSTMVLAGLFGLVGFAFARRRRAPQA